LTQGGTKIPTVQMTWVVGSLPFWMAVLVGRGNQSPPRGKLDHFLGSGWKKDPLREVGNLIV